MPSEPTVRYDFVTEDLLPVATVKKILESGRNRSSMNTIAYHGYVKVWKIMVVDDQIFSVLQALHFVLAVRDFKQQ